MVFYYPYPTLYFPVWFPAVGTAPAPAPSGTPIHPRPRKPLQVQFPHACCKPVACYVAAYTYTARKGDRTATVTRNGESEISYAHARTLARLRAKAEAEAEVNL